MRGEDGRSALQLHQTYPERIRAWVVQQFNPAQVDRVTADLITVATGNREGNSFELQAIACILPTCSKCGADKREGALCCWDCFKGQERSFPGLKQWTGDFKAWLAL